MRYLAFLLFISCTTAQFLNLPPQELLIEKAQELAKEEGLSGSDAREVATGVVAMAKMFAFMNSMAGLSMEMHKVKGDNICEEKIVRRGEPQISKLKNGGSVHLRADCEDSADDVICVMENMDGTITKTVQKCCSGYTTDDIQNGCNDRITETYFKDRNITYEKELFKDQLHSASHDIFRIKRKSIFEYDDGQVIENDIGQKFVVDSEHKRLKFNCIPYKKQIKIGGPFSSILIFDGVLRPAADNVLQIIEKDPRLSRFYKSLSKDLKFTLMNKKGLTVFAFTNDAFEKMPKEAREMMKKNEAEHVIEVMKSHISSDGIICADMIAGQRQIWHLGGGYHMNTDGKDINGRNIIDKDYYALNGVVHIIDGVIIKDNFFEVSCDSAPSSNQTIAEFLGSRKDLSRFNRLYNRVRLRSKSSFLTIYAPTNDAIPEKIPRKRNSAGNSFAEAVVGDHILKTVVCSSNRYTKFKTLNGDMVSQEYNNFSDRVLTIGNAEIIEKDHVLKDGVVHVVNKLIKPFTA